MFKKVLVADRGTAACQIFQSLKTMKIDSVAIYADCDSDSLHIHHADEAHSIGNGDVSATYLNQDKIIAIAKQCEVDAIHPGCGFLSESPAFAARCVADGLKYIGAKTEHLRIFSLKHETRQVAKKCGIVTVPDSPILHSLHDARHYAETIGFPIILKCTAGRGGIGMQVCRNMPSLEAAFHNMKALAEKTFTDGRMMLERYIERARHIEVQVFGSGDGTVVNLGERDCSAQHRHQKIVEEAPAPALGPSLRQELWSAACRILASVDYESAATVEFILDTDTQTVYFLEVDTGLRVEHRVTEKMMGVDITHWMIEQAYQRISGLCERRAALSPKGHVIQARICAEGAFENTKGRLSHAAWPNKTAGLEIHTWIETGTEISAYFDPMLAKIVIQDRDRDAAVTRMRQALDNTQLYGLETNVDYLKQLLRDQNFEQGQITTGGLNALTLSAPRCQVLKPGTHTTIQDLPARLGYWRVGVPPSGPFDRESFRLGNALLENPVNAAGLEITLQGPTLRFTHATQIAVCGAAVGFHIDGRAGAMWQVIDIKAGQTVKLGAVGKTGTRAYLLIKGGWDCPDYLGSKSTFTLGGFGGHQGRTLRTDDILRYFPLETPAPEKILPEAQRPSIGNHWTLRVTYGPHGAPDFLTEDDLNMFFSTRWEVHFNSSRTGIRLNGPTPKWARESGGEAGLHPSNIHDNAYAFGTVDFTGDMPVILGPDGPSLGGFVCPATVIEADRWKLGQMRAGDSLQFCAVSVDDALQANPQDPAPLTHSTLPSPVFADFAYDNIQVRVRLSGERFFLVEFGEPVLDIDLRVRVQALFQAIQDKNTAGIIDLTPGVRSLQIHFDPTVLAHKHCLDLIEQTLEKLPSVDNLVLPSRIVHLPLSWDDSVCREAIEIYQQSVRPDAPWCPSNIEFIRRINGLNSVEDVKNIVFDASYLVLGLGDVYLGAPVATPMDPRHRLVTTKYNPARTWTAENSVGIGGAYLCVYGMEGPGGYQFVGRTLQMWNRDRTTREFKQPWLLQNFDQLRFYPVSESELKDIRYAFPRGQYPLSIENTQFSLAKHKEFLEKNQSSISVFQQKRTDAFQEELSRWRSSGQLHSAK